MGPFSVDAYTPEEIASRLGKTNLSKCTVDPLRVLALSLFAGAFVALGFEYSVANMFFIPAGLLTQTEIGTTMMVSEQLTIGGFFWHNLIPVTLGNMLGVSVFVCLFYWFIYLCK